MRKRQKVIARSGRFFRRPFAIGDHVVPDPDIGVSTNVYGRGGPEAHDCGLAIADSKVPVAGGRRRRDAQEKPIFARGPGNGRGWAGREGPPAREAEPPRGPRGRDRSSGARRFCHVLRGCSVNVRRRGVSLGRHTQFGRRQIRRPRNRTCHQRRSGRTAAR
jgi:hypothetical protein